MRTTSWWGRRCRWRSRRAPTRWWEALRQGGVREPERRIAGVLDAAAYGLYRKGKGDLADGIATVVKGVLRGV
jgi:hypothetical protein